MLKYYKKIRISMQNINFLILDFEHFKDKIKHLSKESWIYSIV